VKGLLFNNPRRLVIAAIILVLLAYFVVVLPVQQHYRSLFLKLNPADVDTVTLEMQYRVNDSFPAGKVVLTEQERDDFLKLLAGCHVTFLNHPKGLWICKTSIITRSRAFELLIHGTSNNGTYISLYSNGANGRNIGDFRNDDLTPFLMNVLSRPTSSVPIK